MKFGMFYFAEYAEVVTGSMLIVTIFLGGWALPFFHRDGLTIAFGGVEILHASISHLWMTLIGVLAFFGKVLAVCFVQVFVRWTLPRFRYDQLMKLGWRVLLPLSLANVLVTGLVWLALDQAGPGVGQALKTVGDVTQAVVVVTLTYLMVRLFKGIYAPSKHDRTLLGSSAAMAEKQGGTKTEAMQS
jgi:NADH-quinone oxidoreductase subunit H